MFPAGKHARPGNSRKDVQRPQPLAPSPGTLTLLEEFATRNRARHDLDGIRVWVLDPPDPERGHPLLLASAGDKPHGALRESAVLDALRRADPKPAMLADAEDAQRFAVAHRSAFAGFPLVSGDVRAGYVETYRAAGFSPETIAELGGDAARLAATLSSASAARASESPSRGTILVCDDDPGIRTLLAVVLGRRGFSVLQAENGLLALEQTKRSRPDLVVIDWLMPVMDGRETVEKLKREPETRDIPVVMLTSQSSVEDKVAALESGAQDYLTKPFDQRELVARLEQQMRWRKLLVETTPPPPPAGEPPAGRDVRDELARAIRDAERFVAKHEHARAAGAYRTAAVAAGRLRDTGLGNRLLRLAGTMYLTAAEAAHEARAIQDGYLNAARCFLITGNLRLAKRSIDAALGDEN